MKAISNKDSNPYDRPERLVFAKDQIRKYGKPPETHRLVHVPDWVSVGYGCTIHEGVRFTEGFGYARDKEGKWLHIPHTGGIVIGNYVDIYPDTTINRGTVNDTIIGDGTKIDHHCHIGHNSKIGENCLITAGVIIAGGAIIGDNVWIGPHSSILNNKEVARGCMIGQQSNIVTDFLQEDKLIYGNPAKAYDRLHLFHNKIG